MTDDQSKILGQVFTMAEAAERLRISRRSLQDLIKVHPHYSSNGARKLFDEGDIAALWQAMRQPVRRANPLFFQPATSSPAVVFTPPSGDIYAELLGPRRKRRPGTARSKK